MKIFCIVGAGSFGLMCALNLRETYKNAKIIIFDKNKDLSSSVNGGNGMLKYMKQFRFLKHTHYPLDNYYAARKK